jgi:hypothetical protein
MKNPAPFDINIELGKVKIAHEQFLQQLKQIKIAPKESFIQSEYNKNLNELAPWLSIAKIVDTFYGETTTPITTNEPIEQMAVKESVDQILAKINAQPSKKTTILNEYLSKFPELSEADRMALVNNFKALEPKNLKKELENISQLFQ